MNIKDLASDIRDLLIDNIPVESDTDFLNKHIKRGKKLFQAVASDDRSRVIPIGTNGYAFELGSADLEVNFPHYHILEDAYTIHKRGKGTTTSKGSQAQISNVSARDYGKWTIGESSKGHLSGYQEYRKNVRGKRKPKAKYKVVSEKVVDWRTGEVSSQRVFADASSSYVNKHYHYIEKCFDYGLPFIAQKYGMRMGRTSISNEELLSSVMLPALVE